MTAQDLTLTRITVSGMTCGHCTSAVTEELTTIDGVTDVGIDLVSGGESPVTITSRSPLNPEDITTAVDEAGYTATV